MTSPRKPVTLADIVREYDRLREDDPECVVSMVLVNTSEYAGVLESGLRPQTLSGVSLAQDRNTRKAIEDVIARDAARRAEYRPLPQARALPPPRGRGKRAAR